MDSFSLLHLRVERHTATLRSTKVGHCRGAGGSPPPPTYGEERERERERECVCVGVCVCVRDRSGETCVEGGTHAQKSRKLRDDAISAPTHLQTITHHTTASKQTVPLSTTRLSSPRKVPSTHSLSPAFFLSLSLSPRGHNPFNRSSPSPSSSLPSQKLRNLYLTYGTSTSSSSAVSLQQISKVMYDCLGLYSAFDTSVTRVDIGIGILCGQRVGGVWRGSVGVREREEGRWGWVGGDGDGDGILPLLELLGVREEGIEYGDAGGDHRHLEGMKAGRGKGKGRGECGLREGVGEGGGEGGRASSHLEPVLRIKIFDKLL